MSIKKSKKDPLGLQDSLTIVYIFFITPSLFGILHFFDIMSEIIDK